MQNFPHQENLYFLMRNEPYFHNPYGIFHKNQTCLELPKNITSQIVLARSEHKYQFKGSSRYRIHSELQLRKKIVTIWCGLVS